MKPNTNQEGAYAGETHSNGMDYTVEGQLTAREADGSVAGSYPLDVMENLLHYHRGEVEAAAGQVVMAGETVEA